jgi:hypothetical protein
MIGGYSPAIGRLFTSIGVCRGAKRILTAVYYAWRTRAVFCMTRCEPHSFFSEAATNREPWTRSFLQSHELRIVSAIASVIRRTIDRAACVLPMRVTHVEDVRMWRSSIDTRSGSDSLNVAERCIQVHYMASRAYPLLFIDHSRPPIRQLIPHHTSAALPTNPVSAYCAPDLYFPSLHPTKLHHSIALMSRSRTVIWPLRKQ